MSVQLWICAGYTALCIEYWWLHWIMERRTLPQDQDQEAPLTLGWHQSCFLIILSAFLLHYQLCWWRWAEENSDCGNCCVLTLSEASFCAAARSMLVDSRACVNILPFSFFLFFTVTLPISYFLILCFLTLCFNLLWVPNFSIIFSQHCTKNT